MLNTPHKRAFWRTGAFGLLAAGALLMVIGLAGWVVTRPPVWTQSPGVLPPTALGAVLLILGGIAADRHLSGVLLRRKVLIIGNVAAQVVFLAAAVVLANATIARHYVRFDTTQKGIFSLSPLTDELLAKVSEGDRDIRVTAFFESPGDTQKQWLQERINGLLREYDSRSARLVFETILIDREQQKARAFRNRLARSIANNSIVFESGTRVREVQWLDLCERRTRFAGGRTGVEITRFKGEQVLTAAIKWVLMDRKRHIYFSTGHGERDIENGDAVVGYGLARQRLEDENYVVEKLNLIDARSVPAECAVLIVAGPRSAFAPEELGAVAEYMEQGGSLLLMADPKAQRGVIAGLKEIVAQYGITVRDDVYAPVGAYFGLFNEANHKIAQGCAGYRAGFLGACALQTKELEALSDQPFYRATAIVQGAREVWGETSVDDPQKRRRFDMAEDLAGPLTVVMAAERVRRVENAVPAQFESTEGARLVVIADSDCLVNGVFDKAPGNQLLLVNAVAWLDQDSLPPVQIPAQDLDYRPLKTWDERIRRTVMLLCVVLMPLLALAFGGFVWIMRRR